MAEVVLVQVEDGLQSFDAGELKPYEAGTMKYGTRPIPLTELDSLPAS